MLGFVFGALLAIMLVVVGLAFFNKRPDSRATKEVRNEPAQPANESSSSSELDQLFGRLADCLLELRLSEASQVVFDNAMQVVDKLYLLLPQFVEKHGRTELAFVLVQIGKNYLPNLLTPYSEMSRAAQQSKEQELINALALLQKEIQKVQDIYDRGEVNSFETEAIFLKNKFLAQTIEAGLSGEGS